ncbi:hypothetical protein CFK37_06360 [Virgibacillus phasianinus]|uniref:Uncharacterized protein n=1 Tax=Virgibacillus phasianinus TaxID=2017483 RepID=A0A220U197_9BACI|nr:hypothetical protein [Virgibacillus phasianinus]ASK61805.1 hypothetical protein CFK37_06360 [Virgibacillus phasianinus]
MNKLNFSSLVLFLIFAVLFLLMGSGFAFWSLGKIVIIVMVLLPIIGVILAIKGSGWSKWLLFLLNVVALGSMVYIFLHAFGIL